MGTATFVRRSVRFRRQTSSQLVDYEPSDLINRLGFAEMQTSEERERERRYNFSRTVSVSSERRVASDAPQISRSRRDLPSGVESGSTYVRYLRARYTRRVLLAPHRKRRRRVLRVDFVLDDPVRTAGRGVQDLHARPHLHPETHEMRCTCESNGANIALCINELTN